MPAYSPLISSVFSEVVFTMKGRTQIKPSIMRTSLILLVALLPVTLAINCPPGSYIDGAKCTPCPPGSYQEESSKRSCELCSGGTFAPFPGSRTFSQCLYCPFDTYSSSGSSNCTICPQGLYSLSGSSSCGLCGPGKSLSNSYSRCWDCESGYFSKSNERHCKLCASGTFANKESGATSCSKCPPGTYRDIRFVSYSPNSKCIPCPSMSFAAKEGTQQCKLCPLGTISEKGSQQCTSCPPGSFRNRLRRSKCIKCPSGTSSKGKNPAGCSHPIKGCPWGTFEDGSGECRGCMPGEMFDTEKKECIPCGQGEVSSGGADSMCKKCPPGKEPVSDLSIYERSYCQCKVGTTEAPDGGCQKCPTGTHGTKRPAGAIWSSVLRITYKRDPYCTRCDPGFYTDTNGSTKCKFCPVGTVSDDIGSKSCKPCPPGSRSNPDEPFFEGSEAVNRWRSCKTLKFNCDIGEDLDGNGNCRARFCTGVAFLNNSGRCERCYGNDRYDPQKKKCVGCPLGSKLRIRGKSTKCFKCPQHSAPFLFNGDCECEQNYANYKKKCVWCGVGRVAVKRECRECKEGVTRTVKGITSCTKCKGNRYQETIGSDKCTKCPDGFVRSRDVLGQATEGCMPRDRYRL